MDSDAILVNRLKNGEQEAFNIIFDRYRRGILTYVEQIARSRSLAEDVVQETFLELVRRIDRIDPEKSLSGWLYRVARNRAIDVMRRAGREVPAENFDKTAREEDMATVSMPYDEMQSKEENRHLVTALGRIDDRLREVLLLRYHGNLAFREIAATLRRPIGTVLWQAKRGIEKLREILMQE
jgi:RNA polymerase sigma-70 factor (ECF subfamily)